MDINLLDIPEDGKYFNCDEQTGELNEALKDLIGDNQHKVEFAIRPVQSGTFELTGKVETCLNEQCSKCGLDFCLNLNEKFKELLVPVMPSERTAKYSKPNHYSDLSANNLSTVEYESNTFKAGDFLHEVIALAEPTNPVPEANKDGKCSVCNKELESDVVSYEDPGFQSKKSPFEDLKKLKIN